jgi:hypothetical protein
MYVVMGRPDADEPQKIVLLEEKVRDLAQRYYRSDAFPLGGWTFYFSVYIYEYIGIICLFNRIPLLFSGVNDSTVRLFVG